MTPQAARDRSAPARGARQALLGRLPRPGSGSGRPGPDGSGRRRPKVFTPKRVTSWYETVSLPIVILFVLHDRQIHKAHRMTWRRKYELGFRLYRITRSVACGTSYRALLAMAAKVLHAPPRQRGVVVECGCWVGGSTAALSVICEYADRQLIVYDSFEGLPVADPRDEMGNPATAGAFRGALELVQRNVREHGVIERCTFRKGWVADTLPSHTEPVVLAYVDVDYQESLHDCIVNLWPHLTDTGYVFIDEFHNLRYCALFWSERWWRTYLDAEPPGLLGSGTGIGLGQFWVGPNDGRFGRTGRRPYQVGTSIAYTRKDFSGYWSFYPDR